MDKFKLRCRRCRFVVLTQNQIVNTHGQPIHEKSCSSSSTNSVWHVSMESDLFPWIQEAVYQASWTKGKLSCPKCHGRIGSFDFVSSLHCPCGEQTLPGVHILRDRVDLVKPMPSRPVSMVTQVRYTSGKKTELILQNHPASQMVMFDRTEKSLDGQKIAELQKCVNVSGSVNIPLCDILGIQDSEKYVFSCKSNTKPSNSDLQIKDSVNLLMGREQVPFSDLSNSQTPLSENGNVGTVQTERQTTEGDRDRNICVESNVNGTDLQNQAFLRRKVREKIRRRHRQLDSGSLDLDQFKLKEEGNRFCLLSEEEISSDDDVLESVCDDHVCPVCLDVYFHPHTCHPCGHMFCESCLRQLAQKSDNSTSFRCPMCRELIRDCCLKSDLTHQLKVSYPESYKCRLITDRKYLSRRFPLPRSRDRQKPPTLNDRIVSAVSQHNWNHLGRLSVKSITFLGSVLFVLLVLCVSMAL